ncbi:unnamed protein product [Symbiodinium natans]|uniref:Uncharacterized protein n=1 Tax=Symbiodinium natans TaxID=878477 RepID=A0A812LZC1_9DINO|nr:unnamed protein product [Symbiodinium natans]
MQMDADAFAEEMRALASKHQRQLLDLATSQSDSLLAALESFAGGVPDNAEAAMRLEVG